MMRGIRVRADDRDGTPVIALGGEVDQAVVPGIQEAVRAATCGAEGWTLDLAGVTYLDSSGLRLLLDLERAAADGGQAFAVVPPRPGMALRALRISGVDRRLGIPTAPDAETGPG